MESAGPSSRAVTPRRRWWSAARTAIRHVRESTVGAPALTTSLVLAVFLGVVGSAQVRLVKGSLPYVLHPDDTYITDAARRILQSGDLNPHWYSYPTLPAYIATGSLALGLIHASGEARKALTVRDIGSMSGAYYRPAAAVQVVREVWILMALLAVGATAAWAFSLGGWRVALFAAMVIVCSPVWLAEAWTYVNVDTPLSLFIAAGLAHLLTSLDRNSLRDRSIVPGMLCGAAMASKYTGALLLLPCGVIIWSRPTRDSVLQTVMLGITAVATFAALSPFFFLDLPHFLDGLAFESWHYRVRGHRGAREVAAGMPQALAYLTDAVSQCGTGLSVFAAFGLSVLVRERWRAAAVLTAFFVVWVLFFAQYKVHFNRNALPLFMLFPVISVLGAVRAYDAAVIAISARRVTRDPRIVRAMVAATILAAASIGSPGAQALERLTALPDTRNQFAEGAALQLPAHAELLIPQQLKFSSEGLPKQISVSVVDLTKEPSVARWLQGKPGSPHFALLPRWDQSSLWMQHVVTAMQPGVAALGRQRVLVLYSGLPAIPGARISPNPEFSLVRLER